MPSQFCLPEKFIDSKNEIQSIPVKGFIAPNKISLWSCKTYSDLMMNMTQPVSYGLSTLITDTTCLGIYMNINISNKPCIFNINTMFLLY